MKTLDYLIGLVKDNWDYVYCPDCHTEYFSGDLNKAFQQGLGDIIWCACGEEYSEQAAKEALLSKDVKEKPIWVKQNEKFQKKKKK